VAEVETSVVPPVFTPLLPVSLQEPATAVEHASARAAAPVPDFEWKWAGPPIAATGAFLATLAALLVGFWTGYGVGSGSVHEPAVTVAEASEKAAEPVMISVSANGALSSPAAQAPQAEDRATNRSPGLHLQVSALSSREAASDLRRQLESRGFPVRIEQPSRDELVRVYVGPAADTIELRDWTSELRKEGLKPFPKRL
jgi:hypothetical protein